MARVLKLDEDADLPMPRGQDEAARKFYGRILGLRETMRAPGERGVWFDVHGKKLRLRVADPMPPPSDSVKAHLEVDNVESIRQATLAARGRAWDAPAMAGTKGAILGDPFGNRVEIREYRPGASRERVLVREEAGDE